MPADALHRRQDLGDQAAPLLELLPQRLLAGRRAGACCSWPLAMRSSTSTTRAGGFDDLSIELAAVVADRLDLAL